MARLVMSVARRGGFRGVQGTYFVYPLAFTNEAKRNHRDYN